ncbi:PaaI family thioesterase [Bacillus sp. SD088]|uniref:PaaI family thioesterase n=1 Tax=Bacillus sp. SD088 TaxID=2782012 RepID=UPI001A968769|nr:PaaI family thioesterase [Bacillus sp. SD088]MBO0992716.1 PaaI family thioesterase [Bacillus sp. SD088]
MSDLKAEIQQRLKHAPFNKFLNIEVLEVDDTYLKAKLPFQEIFQAGSEERGWYIHGGVIASFIDVIGDYVFVPAYGQPLPTVDLRIDYLRAAKAEDLYAEATLVKGGRALGVSDIKVTNDNQREIAIGRGVYSTQGATKRAEKK